MSNNDRHVELTLGLDPSGIKEGLQQGEQLMREGLRRMSELQSSNVDPATIQGFIAPPPPPPPLSSDSPSPQGAGDTPAPLGGNPYLGTPPPPPLSSTQGGAAFGQGDGAGALGELHQRLNVIQQMAQSSPDIARANLSRLQDQTLNASLKDPDRAREYQDLIDAIKGLSNETRDNTKQGRGTGEFLNWMRANAGLQLGGQVMRQAQGGNLLSAIGTGAGGLLGLMFGPAGMAMGASIGGGIGSFIEGIAGGARGAREYERNATDLARRFGDTGNLASLRDYNLGGEYGFKAEESLQLYDQLRQERVVDSASEATPLVQGIQQLTRALGLNADATTKLYAGYVQTGGERGEQGLREYFADIVGGAISAGFEGNLDQYAELMASARMQIVQGSGVGVSDRAFGQLQDVLANLTGTGSNTSQLLRDNPVMAQQALSTFMAMGGTTDPYGMGAGFLRLAGVEENALDRRFTTADQQVDNAEKALQFLSARMLESSGMSASDFASGARGDENFVQQQLSQNVALQRQLGDFLLPGLLGRDATATDIRAFEQLSNIMIANGGALPDASGPGGAEVEKLLAQLGGSPADEARKAEAERHNKQMEVMSHFQDLMTRTDQWMANIFDWINENLALDEIAADVEGMLDWIEIGATAIADWAKENNIAERVNATLTNVDTLVKLLMPVTQAIGKPFGETRNALLNPGQVLADVREDPLGAARRAFATGWGITTPGMVFNGARAARRALDADDEFNDTPPGGVVATERYNTFRFAPGDRVEARRAGPEFESRDGAATLEDVIMILSEGHGFDAQFHQEDMEAGKLIQETLDAIAELHTLIEANIEEQTKQIQPSMLENLLSLVGLTGGTNELLAKIEGHLPIIQNLIQSVGQAISMMGMRGGGMGGGFGGGGGGGGIFSPLQGASIDDILNYDPSRGQSFLAYRNRRSGPDIHGGVDFDRRIGAGEGGVVVAPEGGTAEVIRIGSSANGGSVQVRIRFTDEQGREITHRLNHLDQEAVYQALGIRPGEGSVQVQAGQVVGSVGATDNLSSGAHLDWKVLVGGQFVDPQEYLRARSQGGGSARTVGGSSVQINAAPTGGPGIGGAATGSYNPNIDPQFAQQVAAIADRLGTRPEYLLAAMGFETGGTFDPSIRNAAGSGATGLIQFMPATARGLGTSTSALAGMTRSEQLEYVERYLQPYAGQLNSLEDVYMSILYPAAIGRGAGHGLFRQGTTAYRQNRGLDINQDGVVTVGEATNKVREYLPSQQSLNRLYGGGRGGPSGAAAGFANQFGAVGGAYRQGQDQAYGGGNNFTASIQVNVDGSVGSQPDDYRDAAYQGTLAATDEFEQRWRQDPNPRNEETRGPVFA